MTNYYLFFMLDTLLLTAYIDTPFFLNKKTSLYLAVVIVIGFSLTFHFFNPLLTVIFLTTYTLLKFFVIYRRFNNFLVPMMAILKNIVFLTIIWFLLRDIPEYFLKINILQYPGYLLLFVLLHLLSFVFLKQILNQVIHNFYLEDIFYLLQKKYFFKAIFVAMLLLSLCLLHEHYFELYDGFGIISTFFFIVITGNFLILYFLNFVRRIYLEQLINSLDKNADSYYQKYTELSEFKHDYKNILLVLRNYLEKKDLANAEKYLNDTIDYSQKFLSSAANDEINKINMFPIKALTSELYKKITESSVSIDFNLFVRTRYFEIPMDMVDFIRCYSILLDNAYEACLSQEHAELDIYLYSNGDYHVIEVKNSLTESISLAKIFKKKFTTKKHHSGYGLTNLNKIISSYKTVDYSIDIVDHYFVSKIIIKKA